MQDLLDRIWIAARTALTREDGQTMTEYALILGLISVFAIGAVATIGSEINTILTRVVTALPG